MENLFLNCFLGNSHFRYTKNNVFSINLGGNLGPRKKYCPPPPSSLQTSSHHLCPRRPASSSDTPPPPLFSMENRSLHHLLGHFFPFPRPGTEEKLKISEMSTKNVFSISLAIISNWSVIGEKPGVPAHIMAFWDCGRFGPF